MSSNSRMTRSKGPAEELSLPPTRMRKDVPTANSFLSELCKVLFTGFLVPGLFSSRLHLLSEVCACFGEW